VLEQALCCRSYGSCGCLSTARTARDHPAGNKRVATVETLNFLNAMQLGAFRLARKTVLLRRTASGAVY
jgi:hypothetical protein